VCFPECDQKQQKPATSTVSR